MFAKAYLCDRGQSPETMKRKLAAANPGSLVQAVAAGTVENEFLIEMLAAQTLQAKETGSMLANKPEIDFLLRVAGSTQISRAIRMCGSKEGNAFVLVAAGKRKVAGLAELGGQELPRSQLAAPERAVVERGALLSAQRP